MQVTVISSHRAAHQLSHQAAMVEGLRKIGIEAIESFSAQSVNTKHVACWGWRLGKSLRERGHEVLVMERGYIGDRFKYTSLGWNGLNGHATFPEYPDDGGERFREHGGIIEPIKSGKYALILGQVRNDASLQGKDISSWYSAVAKQISAMGIPVYFRPHPEGKRRGGYSHITGVKNLSGDLHDALAGAKFTVAFNSNSCLDSVLYGVPCYAGDRGTMAYDLCMKDLSIPEIPDREKIAHSIAWKQWTIEEISSGLPQKKLFECLPL